MSLSTDACLSLANQLAPETIGKLDVIRHYEPTLGPPPVGADAWAVHGRHIGLRDELRRLGRWPGYWTSVIVFCTEPTVEHLIHELSHVLPSREPLHDVGEPTAVERLAQVEQLTRFVMRADERTSFPWTGHCPRFVRVGVHLFYRAQQLGYDVGQVAANIGGKRYELSDLHWYADRFGDEPIANADRPFSEISRLPFPPGVLALFGNDARAWAINSLIGETL